MRKLLQLINYNINVRLCIELNFEGKMRPLHAVEETERWEKCKDPLQIRS